MFADIEIAHTIDHNYDINDKFARPQRNRNLSHRKLNINIFYT